MSPVCVALNIHFNFQRPWVREMRVPVSDITVQSGVLLTPQIDIEAFGRDPSQGRFGFSPIFTMAQAAEADRSNIQNFPARLRA